MKLTSVAFLLYASPTNMLQGKMVANAQDHGGNECTHGKLYISSQNSTTVHVYDLNRSLESMYNERNVSITTAGGPEVWLDSSASSQVVAAIYRGTLQQNYQDGIVNWIETGFGIEDHGDHYHIEYSAPKLIANAAFSCSRPIHFTRHDNKIAIFCDGSYAADPQVNSTVWVIDESKFGFTGSPIAYVTTILGSHHGVAVSVDDDHAFHSVATPERILRNSSNSLPSTFRIIDYSGNEIHAINNITSKDLSCSGYHGSAAVDNIIALACDASHGGLLIVQYNNVTETSQSRALLYPSPGYPGHRTGTLVEHPKSKYVVGNFGNATSFFLLAFQFTDTALTGTNLLPLPSRQCGFDFEKSDGEVVLTLMPNGNMYAYNISQGWNVIAQVQVVPAMSSCSQATFVTGHLQAFVMVYSTTMLYAVNLEKVAQGMLVVTPTRLPYTPLSAVVAGAPEAYACSLKPKVVDTNHSITDAPVAAPSPPSREPCGLFGLSIFCPFPGKCGFIRRLLRIGGC